MKLIEVHIYLFLRKLVYIVLVIKDLHFLVYTLYYSSITINVRFIL